ncbi:MULTISPECIES: ABC transporter family substrate-binding protein [Pseudonocardia]|uniref:Peptide ABC transporter substrate-binding protein n=1 Tax=Pseudonocardia saturnea TaxID=33909 RepID=A0ABQ0S7I9_9PSEU|nr:MULTISPECIES: ABC transporter family substrate-binding protein [Pseudonocardia]BBF99900.1 peptide ABC transporter substrate-binding protein [Pseudonocardia autotrophica]GEC28883.1 peptide ABC transporter substrate-binding protein [Pseudonocardia saturnea]
MRARRPFRALPALLLACLLALTACSADPQPAPAPDIDAPTEPVTTPTRVVAGVDELGPGFNPHLRSDQSPVTTAIATMALPSVFRPDAEGNPQLDRTVATDAKVTSQEPFTVSYELNVEAGWSTGAPIAAEDFVYLWQQMRTQPNTIGAAGYREISDVRSRAAGKAVDVVFDRPYPHWKELFDNLLPAHLLKDAPGGWTAPFANGVPASGGPFRLMQVDRLRGEVLLVRNDPYWDTSAVIDEIVLRRIPANTLPTALESQGIDLALPDARPEIGQALEVLAGSPEPPTVQRGPRPAVQQLEFRTQDGPLADPRVREGIAAMLDRAAIRERVSPEAVPVDAFGAAPSDAGYQPSAPPGAPARPDPAVAEAAFTEAGYVRGGNGRWTLGGRPLSVVIGAGAERSEDVEVARVVAEQLTAGGIQTTIVAPSAPELLTSASVAPITPSPTTTPAPGAGPAPGDGAAEPPQAAEPTTPAPTTAPTTAPSTSPTTAAGGGSPVAVDVLVASRPAYGALGPRLNSAYGCPPDDVDEDLPGTSCFPVLQPLLDELTGSVADPGVVAEAERVLWRQLPALPLYQAQGLVISNRETDASTRVTPGPVATGPMTGAQTWSEPEGSREDDSGAEDPDADN